MQTLSKKFSVFVAITLWFAMSFQAVHVYSHYLENQKHVAQQDNQHDKCYVCDFHFSPYLVSNPTVFQPIFWRFNKVEYTFSTNDYQHLSSFYFSLRGPPILG
ncbi:MAG TPA: hypothetical protein VKY32_07550 [Flavobacterium sp.]|nr:hypothetical protein [Flavobacterium sp.]